MDTTLYSSVSLDIEGAIYDTAMQLDADARQAFLEKVFRGDANGLARMLRLLKRSGESSAFFLEAREHGGGLVGEILGRDSFSAALAPDETVAPPEEPGSRIGFYRLIERIGEGGCGVVYEAEQQEPVQRRVALKIIRLGMDTERVIARFEAERQVLAMMDHPNIARVIDAGATATGRPYFVMERVSGERITACCDREGLDLVARIDLFIQVCGAIQHAHKKGVIHRDIKPSNVLVTMQDGAPVPKVIDFGIAKAAEPADHRDRTRWTSRDQFIGTPPYMSPEQVDMSGIDVDTRSDIYSLGALLHELLGGRAPFDSEDLRAVGVSGMRRVLLEKEPPLLSRMLAALPPAELEEIAALRDEEPTRLIARMRGDLDWIVAKAMAKDRNQRYQTVNSLVADLHHFLRHEPVLARQPSRRYLLEKFIRRNRAVCISAAAVVVSLVGGFGASTWLYLNERKALAVQEQMGREAEAARARETHMRAQAQARANVSQAAVLLSEGRIEAADVLLKESPLKSIEPSREAAGVFRALGNWNAIYGRWAQAVQCYVLLDQANRLDDPVNIVEDTDLLAIAATLREYGGPGTYEKFRGETLDYYFPARNSLQAEHLLKVCLLAPAGEEVLSRLKEAAGICSAAIPAQSGRMIFPEWNAFSMALYYHRLGDFKQALAWGEKCLSYPDPAGTRAAGALAMTAVARFRTGQPEDALRDFDAARGIMEDDSRHGTWQSNAERRSWFSCLIARTLLKEAEHEIGQAGH